MAFDMRYMGSKRRLVDPIRGLINESKKGPLLDVFSGMCAIGSSIAPTRQVWTNDAQVFATAVGRSLFCSDSVRPSIEMMLLKIYPHYDSRLRNRVSSKSNKSLLNILKYDGSKSYCELVELEQEVRTKKFKAYKKGGSYSLFENAYAATYLSLMQCLEVDALREVFDELLDARAITKSDYDWFLILLGHAIIRCSNSTGHFAQYMKINEKNFKRSCGQRSKRIWVSFLNCAVDSRSFGTRHWRAQNVSTNLDAESAIDYFTEQNMTPGVIYADPPYTDDQYSRYYHLLDTLIKYDYPELSGEARSRVDKFSGGFSLKTKVYSTFKKFIEKCSVLDCDLIVSYTANGLLQEAGYNLIDILTDSYRHVEMLHIEQLEHSTLGGSNGTATVDAKEIVYRATS